MRAELKKQIVISADKLSESEYVSSLLQEAYRLNLLSEAELKQIQIQIVELLSKQIDRFTMKESSSVKVETAQELLQSALYKIGLYLKTLPDTDAGVLMLKNTRLSELFDQSKRLVKKQVIEAKLLYKAVQKNRIQAGTLAYNDTIDHAISEFFTSYDIEFGAHETMASIDYPLCFDQMNTVGIEYIGGYLKKLYVENMFCQKFSNSEISALLNSYDKNYQDLLINIYDLILTNSVGMILLNQSAFHIMLTAGDLTELQQKLSSLSKAELDNALKKAGNLLFKELNITNLFLREYIENTLKKLSAKLQDALQKQRLAFLFVQQKDIETQTEIAFNDGGKLDDELFRKITEDIRNCSLVSEKIAIIENEVHSVMDLVDILEADCIFEDEFTEVFRSLDDFELALLIQRLPSYHFDEDLDAEKNENESEWQSQLVVFLRLLNDDRLKAIRELSKRIVL